MAVTGGRLTAVLASTLVAVMVAGAGIAYAVGRSQNQDSAASAGSTGTGRSATGDTGSAGAPSSQHAPTGGEPDSAGATGDQDDEPSAGTGSAAADDHQPLDVSLSASAEDSANAQQVRDLLQRYFTAINNHDYDAWLATVTTAQSQRSRESWMADYRTTRDSDVYVSDINDGDPLTVRMQFVSHQSVDLAPTALPLPCVRWDVTYQIIDEGPGLRVGTSAKPPAMAPCS